MTGAAQAGNAQILEASSQKAHMGAVQPTNAAHNYAREQHINATAAMQAHGIGELRRNQQKQAALTAMITTVTAILIYQTAIAH